MATLNKMAESIAYAFNKQDDYTFREVIKYNIEIYRELLLRREEFNSGLNTSDFVSKIIMPLEETGDGGLISKKPVPSSIRFKGRGRTRYNFVGTTNGVVPFTETTSFEFSFLKYLNYQKNVIYYLITRDNKIKILNNFKLCDVRIDGVFRDIKEVSDACEEDMSDKDYPISGDLFFAIKKGITSGEFRIYPLDEDTVETNDEIENTAKK